MVIRRFLKAEGRYINFLKKNLCGYYAFRQSPGKDLHRLFHHFLQDLAGGLDLLDQAGDLAGEPPDVLVLVGLDKGAQQGGGDEHLGGEGQGLQPGLSQRS